MGASADRDFPIVANLLCLDLVNTEPMQHGRRVDTLRSFSDLVAWLDAAGVLRHQQAPHVEARWGGTPQGQAALAEAIELRGALRTMAERIVSGKTVGDATVEAINRVLASRPGHLRLAREGRAFKARFVPLSEEPIHLLVPVAESAADLLEHGDRALVKRCENTSCVLYFYDTTKNRSRRWCSMAACGSRIKAAAYYRRTRVRQRRRSSAATTGRARPDTP